MKKFSNTDEFLAAQTEWQAGLKQLRSLLLATELEETIKWGIPVYTIKNKNVVGLSAFKEYFGLWFYQGAFLEDSAQVLINAQEGITKGMRQWRFSSEENIDSALVTAYLKEAIQNQKEGKMIRLAKPKSELVLPEELQQFLVKNKALSIAFEKLTLGKRREYATYISEAKRVATKVQRLEKIRPMILAGEGLNDRYK